METMNSILQAIANYGFPCVVCLILMWLVYKLNQSHKEEMTKLTEALCNNTKALDELKERINISYGSKE